MASDQIPYGDGWITAAAPARFQVISSELDFIFEKSVELQAEFEPGALAVGPAGEPPALLWALDGQTTIPLSPQLTEFYSYARWWSASALLLWVPDPAEFQGLLTQPGSGLLAQFERDREDLGVLVSADGAGLDPASCALLSVDDFEAPYCRHYLVFDPPENSRHAAATPGEPEVWAFSYEVVHYPDLRSYLASRRAIA